ncbi:MAG: tRNA (adenosine(37)-N6)-threonylcarbamoyltransferase complex transferase subunit TsaD [Patescibacteria group bacterium]
MLLFLVKYQKPDIDLIAVTQGPGLEPCLWVGINFAKALSYFWNIPILPVNHIESHILVNFIDLNSKIKSQTSKTNPKSQKLFPAISLIVSGGHTQLILMKGIGKYQIIGETRDDAAGECFDKCAKILGLGYPGGPIIAKIASQLKLGIRNSKFEIRLPRPMINTKDYDFSFSGLKTAVLYKVRDNPSVSSGRDFVPEMCFEVQRAILDVLIKKTLRAAKDFSASARRTDKSLGSKGGSASGGKVKTIILGGGVSANAELRRQFSSKLQMANSKLNLLVPPVNLSTDNALMIAVAAYFHRNKKVRPDLTKLKKIVANANLRISR